MALSGSVAVALAVPASGGEAVILKSRRMNSFNRSAQRAAHGWECCIVFSADAVIFGRCNGCPNARPVGHCG